MDHSHNVNERIERSPLLNIIRSHRFNVSIIILVFLNFVGCMFYSGIKLYRDSHRLAVYVSQISTFCNPHSKEFNALKCILKQPTPELINRCLVGFWYLNIFTLVILLLENILVMMAYGTRYFTEPKRHLLHYVEFILVLISLGFDLLKFREHYKHMGGILVMMRFWRILRVGEIVMVKIALEDEHKEQEETAESNSHMIVIHDVPTPTDVPTSTPHPTIVKSKSSNGSVLNSN